MSAPFRPQKPPGLHSRRSDPGRRSGGQQAWLPHPLRPVRLKKSGQVFVRTMSATGRFFRDIRWVCQEVWSRGNSPAGPATLNLRSIRLRNGSPYQFDGVIEGIRTPDGETLRVDREGAVDNHDSHTQKTVERCVIGAALGAIIGAVAGGGKGAAIGAVIGAAGARVPSLSRGRPARSAARHGVDDYLGRPKESANDSRRTALTPNPCAGDRSRRAIAVSDLAAGATGSHRERFTIFGAGAAWRAPPCRSWVRKDHLS